MRLFGIIFCLVIYPACTGFGQNLNTQRLKEMVSMGSDAAEQFKIADSIFSSNQFSNLEVVEFFAEELNRLAEASGKEADKIRALQAKADLYFSQGNFFAAKQLAQEILDAGVVLHEHTVIVEGYLRLSESYLYIRRLDFAGFFASRAYDQALENQSDRSVSDALRMMGLVFSELRQDSAALAAFSRSAKILQQDQNYSGNLENSRELSRHFVRAGQYDSASRYLRQLIVHARQANNLLMLGDAYLELSGIEQNAVRKSQLLDSARKVVQDSGSKLGKLKVFLAQGNQALADHDLAGASTNLNPALKIAELLHADIYVLDILLSLVALEEQRGDALTGLKYLRKYTALRDSLLNKDILDNTAKYQLEFPGQAKDREIAALNEVNELRKYELKQEQLIRNIMVVAFLVTAALLYLVFRISRRRVHINKLLVENQQELQRRSAELIELNKLKDKFFSIISHDLKAPINSLAGVLNLMEKNGVKPEELPELTRELKVQFNNTRNLITNLLNWALLQMDRVVVRKEQIDLKNLVDENFRLIETLSNKKLELSNLIDPSVKVYADLNMINLVLRNLIMNAVKFTEAGGFVKVSGEFRGGEYVVCVADNGIGITPEVQGLLLKNNAGYTSRGTANEKGTGLGLSLCKEFVERNNGKIWLTSAPEHGTKFYFTVPIS
jgi:signal transduction histidine kinase